MCNCIKETEEKYKKHLKEKDPTFKGIEDFEVEFVNKGIMLETGTIELVIPIEAEWKHTAKSGRVSTKRKKASFTISFCPFCGEKVDRRKNE